MKVLVVADNLSTFNTKHDCTYIMLQKLAHYGHTIYTCETKHIHQNNDGVFVDAYPTDIALNQLTNWYQQLNSENLSILDFNLILMRTDPPYDLEYIYATYLLEYASTKGISVMNSPSALRQNSEKLSIFKYPQYITPTCVTKDKDVMQQFIKQHGGSILKPLDLMSGRGIFYIDEKATNLSAALELFRLNNNDKPCTLMIQKRIAEIANGDKRILIIGDSIIPYCLTRRINPEKDNVRSNIGAGGTYTIDKLSDKDVEIATAIQADLKKQNIFMAGIDVIGEYLTEINITSPGGFQEITGSGLIDVGEIWYNETIKAINSL
jgi:glutathione synthase